MANFKTLDGLDVAGRRVIVRTDFNVPMKDGEISDVTRIERAAATLRELLDGGARVVVLSHFGRPKGKPESSMSLEPIAAALSQALGGRTVAFADDCIGETAAAVVDGLADGQIALLENLRFHGGEEKNDPEFARALAALGDLYVNDAFSCSHRAHASVVGITAHLPAYAGRLMQGELDALTRAVGQGERPRAALIGGAKVSTKLAVLGHLVPKLDAIIIGGGMANTFMFAEGLSVGRSLHEPELAAAAREILTNAADSGCELILPLDAVVATRLEPNVPTRTVDIEKVGGDDMILDVGPKTVADIKGKIGTCRTLLWNGPLGAFEIPPFDAATTDVARFAAGLTGNGRLTTVAGGGDTLAALQHAGVLDAFSYVSSAGGAFLEWLEGKTLPGVAALESA